MSLLQKLFTPRHKKESEQLQQIEIALENKDYAQALQLLQPLAAKGNAEAFLFHITLIHY